MNKEESKEYQAASPSNNNSQDPRLQNLKVMPFRFPEPEELERKIAEFFQHLEDNTEEVMSASGAIKNIKRPLMPTIEYFASYLDISVSALLKYEKEETHAKYNDIIARAKQKILGYKTLGLINGKGSATGLIFDLVNNHGYKNKSEVETDGKQAITIKVVRE